MANQNPSMLKWHCINGAVLAVLIAFLSFFFSDKLALVYGVFVGLLNLLVAYVFIYWYGRGVFKQVGQSITAVVKSSLVRAVAVCVLLMLGFKLGFDASAMIIGFVLGQFFYFLNQLIRIVEYGK